jgi:hypothetical protein
MMRQNFHLPSVCGATRQMGVNALEDGPLWLDLVILPPDWLQAMVLSIDPDAIEDVDSAVRQDSSLRG